MKFFSADGKFYKFISSLWDIIKLNFLWLVCSLPIITIGASTIAAFTITLQIVEEKEGYVARSFFKAFKENFKQGMAIGPITILFLAVVYMDFCLSDQTFYLVVGIISAFLFSLALVYTFPLLARYTNTLFKTIRNSMRIALRYMGRTLLMIVLCVGEVVVFRLTYITLVIGILVGPICIMLTVSAFSLALFRTIEKEGGVVRKKTEEDEYNEQIEKETEEALKREHIQ